MCDRCGQDIIEDKEFLENESIDAQDKEYVNDVVYSEAENENQIINKYNKPLTSGAFFGMQVLMMVPVVNIILLLIWSFASKINSNRKAYARSLLAWFLIFCVIALFVLLSLIFLRYPLDINFWFNQFKNYINSISSI